MYLDVNTKDTEAVHLPWYGLKYNGFKSVFAIKERILEMENIPIHYQRISHKGTELENEYTLADYSIQSEATQRTLSITTMKLSVQTHRTSRQND